MITFRKAKTKEFDTVLTLLKEAALWLREKKVDYWQDWISPPEGFVSWIKEGFERGEFFIVELNGEVSGCFRLQWSDTIFWGERKDLAGYVHSFTVSRKFIGQGVGAAVLEMIGDYCKGKGKDFLRLDFGVDVEGLKKYYESCGFSYVGKTEVYGEHLSLYEKSLNCENRGCIEYEI